MNDWLEACAKVLLIAGTLIGAGWAYFEYQQKEHQRRIEGTLSYVKRFSEGVLHESTKRIGGVWYANQARLMRLGDSASDESYRQRHHQLVMSVIERSPVTGQDGARSDGIVGDVDAVVYFFSELSICMKAELCDAKAAHAYFDNYAQRFYCLHEPYLSWKATNYASGFGKDLAEFAGRSPQACRSR